MANYGKIGQRLISSLIDEYAANDPSRVWASMPVANEDLSRGFQDITYGRFANAIDTATWWLQGRLEKQVETVAYAGPKDLRYAILAVAALKLGKKILLPSPFATLAAQKHLLDSTGARVYLHARELKELVQSLVRENPEVSTLEIPDQQDWLFGDNVAHFPYTKSWEEAFADPWIIFHTSGTTGLPKPVIYTNWMMTSFDAADLMPDVGKETMNDQFRNKRFYVSLPTLHFVGMTAALQWTTFLNVVLVVAPPGPTTASQLIQTLQYSKAEGAAMAPSQIDDALREPSGLETLRQLKYIYFLGAPLPRSVAEKLVGHCKIQPGMGTTECGPYFIEIRDEDDWEYYRFRDSMGIEMRPRTDELHELVFKRQPHLARWQQAFHLHPELEEFPTSDLWTRHPARPDLWRYGGRADDLVNFTHGESLFATPLEEIIEQHPGVRTAIIGGEGRHRPFVLIDLTDPTKEIDFETVWPYIDRANERCADVVKLDRSRVLFTEPSKPLPRTAKATVLRKPALALYGSAIDRLYLTYGS